MIEKHIFKRQKSGPAILLTGRVHGNEPCGEIALRRFIANLENNSISLKSGTITILPCCNKTAADKNKRYIDVNLNRIFDDHLINQYLESHEASIAPHVMEEIEKADIFIDLHSFTENMPPVVICIDGQNQKSRELAEVCAIKRIMCDSPFIVKSGAKMTTHYARKHNKPAIIVECGQHDDPQSIETAYQSILNILISLDMIDGQKPEKIVHEFLVMKASLLHEEGQKLIFPLMERPTILANDAVFETEHGDIITSQYSGLLIMKNVNTPLHEEYAMICDVYDNWP